jgi:protein-disulfide isomerase
MSENEFFSGSPKTMFFSGFVSGVAIIAVIASIYLANITFSGVVVNTPAEEDNVVADAGTDPAPIVAVDLPAITADDRIKGSADAEVILVEYSDIECPFCERHHPVMEQLSEEYGDKVAWVYRHFPLSFHPEATPAAVATECAGDQGSFFEYLDVLMSNQDSLSSAYYEQVAGEMGLNVNDWKTCIASEKYPELIANQMSAAAAAGVKGTPATFINGKMVSGAVPYDTLKGLIDAELE